MQTRRPFSRFPLSSLILTALWSMLAVACSPSGGSAETMVVLIDNDEGPINPANYNTFIGWWTVGWVYDPLCARSPDLIPVPALATEANQSADGLTWPKTRIGSAINQSGKNKNAESTPLAHARLSSAAS